MLKEELRTSSTAIAGAKKETGRTLVLSLRLRIKRRESRLFPDSVK